MATFILEAYQNQGSDFAANGERDILEKLRPADFKLAIDVGANEGDWSIAALSFWPNCIVHAFEVAPETFQKLKSHVASTPHLDRSVLNECGASDESGEQTMYYYPESPQHTSDTRRHETLDAVPFKAALVRLDDYCTSRGIDRIDFLKIDVEGAEPRVLDGCRELIAAGKIDCIQFEYGAFSIDTRFLLADYFKLLSEKYWMGKVYPGQVEFRDYDWTMEDFKFSNYCCVSRTRPDLKRILEA